MSVYNKTPLQTFRVALSMADLHNVMSMLDCLRSWFCSEFQACSCNINYVKTPYLEQLGKDVQVSFVLGAYFADSKMFNVIKLRKFQNFSKNHLTNHQNNAAKPFEYILFEGGNRIVIF